MKLVPFLVKGRNVNGQIVNREIDFERYEERLGFRPTGNPKCEGRWLLLTPYGELLNVDCTDCNSQWGEGRIVE